MTLFFFLSSDAKGEKKEKCLFAQLSGHRLTDLESRVKSVAEPNLTNSSQKTCLFADVVTTGPTRKTKV